MLKGYDIICISMTFWDAVWLSNHQYMKRLAASNRVLYVERPVTPLSYASPNQRAFVTGQIKRWMQGGIRQIEPSLFVTTPPPIMPLRFEKTVNRLNQWLRTGWTRRIVSKLGFEQPILWIYDPDAGQMVGRMGEQMALYAITDDHLSMAQRSNRIEAMRERERELLQACDLVLTTTDNLRVLKSAFNENTHYVPHGIDSAHFARALDPDLPSMPELANLTPPLIGIVGQINQRIDVDLLAHMAILHPEWMLIFIGPVVRERVNITALEALPNVRFLGTRPAADLPRYLKSIAVCLIPYLLDEHTTYMHPLKTLEYLAAGRPVISTPLPALAHYGEHVTLAGDRDTFIAAVAENLAKDTPERQQARSRYACQQSWENRLERISALIEQTIAARRGSPTR